MESTTPQRIVVMGLQNWQGTPRLPRALRKAGFEVAVICYEGNLLSLTRFANRRFVVQEKMKIREIYGAIWHYVVEWGASSVIAADDKSLEIFYELAALVNAGKLNHQPGKEQVAAMLQRSLPPPGHYASVQKKSAAHALALAAGLLAPPQLLPSSLEQVLAFAAVQGYPLVLKPDSGSAGAAVAICESEAELRESYRKLAQFVKSSAGNRLVVEGFVPGAQLSYPFVALHGKVLAGLTRLKLKAYPTPQSPSSVVEIIARPDVVKAAAKFAAACHYSGFASIQFLLDPATDQAQFLEFNCRPVPMMHMDENLAGIDWCRAWHAAMAGTETPAFAGPRIGRKIALFPQEWLRDPASSFLTTEAIADVPWDDAELLAGFLKLGASPVAVSAPPTTLTLPTKVVLH